MLIIIKHNICPWSNQMKSIWLAYNYMRFKISLCTLSILWRSRESWDSIDNECLWCTMWLCTEISHLIIIMMCFTVCSVSCLLSFKFSYTRQRHQQPCTYVALLHKSPFRSSCRLHNLEISYPFTGLGNGIVGAFSFCSLIKSS